MSRRAGAGTEMLSRQFHEFRGSIFFFSTRVFLKFTEKYWRTLKTKLRVSTNYSYIAQNCFISFSNNLLK